MTQRDPFEDYRRRREIELMEHRFKEKADTERDDDDLDPERPQNSERDQRIDQEMEDFLAESTRGAERALSEVPDEDPPSAEVNRQIRSEYERFLADSPAPGEAPPEPPPAPPPAAAPPPAPAAPPPEAAAPPPTPDPGAGGPPPEESGRPPIDLKAALARIRGGPGDEPAPPAAPPPAQPAPPRSEAPPAAPVEEPPQDLSGVFEETFQQVSEIIEGGFRRTGSNRSAARTEAPEDDSRGAALYRKRMEGASGDLRESAPAAPPPAASAPAPAPAPGGGAGPGGAGATNAFAAEPHEDRDIDDETSVEPEGWDIPVREPPPGAWVVQKQKEEGEAGLAGMAGDTYLLKKLFQEVRRLNRLYLVLLEKGVVTREEVEGPDAGGTVLVDDGGDGGSSDDDDDDCESVDGYEEDRYRPILTTEGDFSISTLVKDVHRLKQLQIVLVKKGIVSDKELAKAKN